MAKYDDMLKKLDGDYANWWEKGYSSPTMTGKLYPYTKMFSPIRVNSVTIKNRLVMAPMGNVSMCDETGKPAPRMIAYFEERAKGGCGLITTGLVPISYGVDASLIEKGDLVYFPRIDRSRTVHAGWRDLAASCHAHGSTLFLQASAGLGRVGNPQCLLNFFKLPVSASWNPNFYIPQIPCKRVSDMGAGKIIKAFGQAAADAKADNIDGIYLHGHEGYLLEQMTNRAFNRRKVGKYANWQRFGIDTIKEIRKRAGARFPIMYRIDLSLMLNATYKDKMQKEGALKKFRNERSIEETLDYMKNLVAAGVDMFDVDLGCYDNWWLPHPPASMPSGCFLEVSKLVKDYFAKEGVKSNAGLPVPVVAVGKLGYPDFAEQALRDEKCDMIMLGRPLLADPDWPNKAYAGRVDTIRPCIGCQEACINEFVEAGHPQCAVNPRCAFELEYPADIAKAEVSKNIAVVGAGPAGIVAAEVLLKRGHKVTLIEKNAVAGGALIAGSAAKIKYEMGNYRKYLLGVVEEMKKNEAFTLRLGEAATAEGLKKAGYDVILFANGSVQSKPPVEGIDGKNVLFAIDVLNNKDLVKDAKDVVIIGGGVVGCETAYFLKYECDKNITVVEMLNYFMPSACTANRGHLLHYLEEGGVRLMNCTKLQKVTADGVVVSKNMHKNVPNPYLRWNPILPENINNPMAKKVKDEFQEETIKCDAVILSAGVRPNVGLFNECVAQNAAPEIYNVGDSLRPARVFEAIRAAYRKARSI